MSSIIAVQDTRTPGLALSHDLLCKGLAVEEHVTYLDTAEAYLLKFLPLSFHGWCQKRKLLRFQSSKSSLGDFSHLQSLLSRCQRLELEHPQWWSQPGALQPLWLQTQVRPH